MNMRTFHKLSEHILNLNDEQQKQNQNKENQISSLDNQILNINNDSMNKKHVSMQDIINLKKMNAKKIQEITTTKDKMLQEYKQNFEKQKQGLIQKYQKIVEEKDQYIKVLEELYSNQKTQTIKQSFKIQPEPVINHFKSTQISKQTTCRTKNENSFFSQPYSQTLYLHQIPLYNQLCYSIQRPIQKRVNNITEFCSTQKIKNRLLNNSNQKKFKNYSSISSSKYRSQSINRGNTSKHVLAPAAPPKYCKIL